MPADGDRQAQLLLGVPLMMEYDTPTRSWKLVVDTELDTVIIISGTVALEPGDLEIGAVEIKDATTDQRAIVNALGQLHVFFTGSFGTLDTELPAAVPLSDALPNPTAPAAGAYLIVYDEGDTWVRARAGFPGQDGVTPNEVDPAVAVASYLQAYDGTGSYNRLLHDPGRNLRVTLVSGAFPPDASVDTELPAAIPVTNGMANPTAPQVLGHTMFYDEDGDTWDRAYNDAGRNLRVTLISGAFPAGETLPVSLASLPNLVATEDEVTAYVTGTIVTEELAGKETYRVVFNGLLNPAGTAVALIGAAGRTLRVTQIQIAKPTVAQVPLRIRKYSTAITSGTFSTPTPVPLDSNNAAASGVVNLYTDVPTDGALVGALFDADVAIGDIIYETFGEQQNAQPVVLRGISEYVSIETSVTGSLAGFIEWTEE